MAAIRHENNMSSETIIGSKQAPNNEFSPHRFMEKYGVQSTLSVNAKEYIDTLTQGFKSAYPKGEVIQLTNPVGTHVFHANNQAIIVMLDEHVPKLNFTNRHSNNTPKVMIINKVAETMNMEYPKIAILHSVLAMAEDYERAANMVNFMVTLFQMQEEEVRSKTARNFFAGATYSVETSDINNVKQFINDRNPHAVMPKTEVGVLISIVPKHQAGLMNQMGNEAQPIVAVGGYVELIQNPTKEVMKFAPIVRITSITCTLPIPGWALIGIYLAAEELIIKNGWMKAFTDIKAKGKGINIGKILSDGNKTQFNVSTVEEAIHVMNQNLDAPSLAIDIAEGTAYVPALSLFGKDNGSSAINDYITKFFECKMDDVQTTHLKKVEYHGTRGAANNKEDTRNSTFLDVMSLAGASRADALPLAAWTNNAEQRCTDIKAWFDFDSKYAITTAVLQPAWLTALGRVLCASGVTFSANSESTNVFTGNGQITAMVAAASSMSDMNNVTRSHTTGPAFISPSFTNEHYV